MAGISGSVENTGSGLQGLLSGGDSHLDQVFCRLHVIVTLEDQGHLLSSYAQLFQLLVKLLLVTEIVVEDGLASTRSQVWTACHISLLSIALLLVSNSRKFSRSTFSYMKL